MNRREILGAGALVGILGTTNLSAQTSKTSGTVSTKLMVTIILDGKAYSYPNGPTIPSYFVFFREDGRIIFHLGALGNLTT